MLIKYYQLWAGGKDGTTAIEFSLLAMPYLILTLGIIELCLLYASASTLEGATNNAARLLRTGEIQQAGGNQEALFREALCQHATILINCDDVVIEVQRMDSFNDFGALGAQFDEDGNLESRGFLPGGSSDRVLVRTAANVEMMTPLVGPLLGGPDGRTMFMSTIVLQTEPYDFEGFDDS